MSFNELVCRGATSIPPFVSRISLLLMEINTADSYWLTINAVLSNVCKFLSIPFSHFAQQKPTELFRHSFGASIELTQKQHSR